MTHNQEDPTHHQEDRVPITKLSKLPKQPFHALLFWCFLISSTLLSFQQQFISRGRMWSSLGAPLLFTLSTFATISRIYGESKKEVLRLFLLIDDLFYSWLITLLGLIGVIIVFHSQEAEDSEDILCSLVINASLLLWIGVYRVLFKHVQWKKWQILLNKICLVAIGVMHMHLVAEFIQQTPSPETLKELTFVFGYF